MDTDQTEHSLHATIAKLKDEINRLRLDLKYEHMMRTKFEEESNRLHHIKIERDQLNGEKIFIEKYLKDLVEQYKVEVEKSLSLQNKLEINAYKEEAEEKQDIIEKMQKMLDDNEIELKRYKEENQILLEEKKNLEKELAEAKQQIERDQSIKTKYEIDYQYMNSLRFTTDVLRKKLLLLTKSLSEKKSNSKQQIQAINNQELNDLVYFFNRNALSAKNYSSLNEPQFDMDNFANAVKTNDYGKLNSQIYQFQQSTIDHLEEKIEKLNNLNNQLLIESASKDTELETYKKELKLKEKKIEELEETNSVEVIAELMKNQYRVYQSLMNVNKRLETEIFQLKGKLNEEKAITQSLNKKLKEDHTKLVEDLMNNFRNLQAKVV